MRAVMDRTKRVMSKFGAELGQDEEFVRSYFEKKLGYKPPVPYHQLIRKPRPDELSPQLKSRLEKTNNNANNKLYDEEF